jgi:hypothetical protein
MSRLDRCAVARRARNRREPWTDEVGNVPLALSFELMGRERVGAFGCWLAWAYEPCVGSTGDNRRHVGASRTTPAVIDEGDLLVPDRSGPVLGPKMAISRSK